MTYTVKSKMFYISSQSFIASKYQTVQLHLLFIGDNLKDIWLYVFTQEERLQFSEHTQVRLFLLPISALWVFWGFSHAHKEEE